MAKSAPSVPLSPMTGGLNRFDGEAGSAQTVDATNVWNRTGDLERRPAFRCVAAGAPYMLPAGKVMVKSWNGATWSTITGRHAGSIDLADYGNVVGGAGLAIGCTEPFDGIDLPLLVVDAAVGSSNRWLKPRYCIGTTVNEANFPAVPWFLDTTLLASHTTDAVHSLSRSGRISWHREWYDDWGLVSLGGDFLYWIILDFSADPPRPDEPSVARTSVVGAPTDPITLSTPGFRAFQMQPVTNVVPVKNRLGGAVLVASSREEKRGQEKGAQLGLVEDNSGPTKIQILADDEGAGTLGTVTVPTWTGGTTSRGSSGLAKQDVSYDWGNGFGSGYNGDWAGQPLALSVAPTGTPTTTSMQFTMSGIVDTEFDDMVIEATTAGGVSAGDRRRIYSTAVSGSTVTIRVSPAWASAPTGTARFKILGPPHMVRFLEPHRTSEVNAPTLAEIETSDNGAQTIRDDADCADRVLSSELSFYSDFVHFELGKELRWTVPSGAWDHTFDSITRQLLLTNGKSGLLTLDGRRLRRLAALADENDPRAQDWLGGLNDLYRKNNLPTIGANAFLLSRPPESEHVIDYMGRIVTSWGNRIRWSAPGSSNDLWPRVYEQLIRDSNANPVTGLARLGGLLIAYTPASIFASEAPGADGFFSFQPVVTGMGFISHRTVMPLPAGANGGLIGCNADGIYLYDGAMMRPLVEDWELVLENGVNDTAMHGAVAGISRFDNLYFAAVPSRGSRVNDKLVVYDFAARAAWVWDAPFGGITAIGTEYSASGQETVYFGFHDGHVGILCNRERDDGIAITGRARTPPMQAGRGTMAMQSLLVTAEDTGSQSLTFRTFVNGQPDARQSWQGAFEGGNAVYGTGLYGTADWGSSANFRTRKLNLPNGTRGEIVQVEVEGTSRWRLRRMELNAKALAQRSR